MATATYRFIVPGRYIGQTVTVFDQATNAQVASGAVGSDGVYSVALTQGDYYATTPDGRYVDADSQGAPSSDAANAAQAALGAAFVAQPDALTLQRLDRQALAKARTQGGVASIAYSDAAELTKDWTDLSGWQAAANAQVSGNRLYAVNGNNPGGALKSFSVAPGESAHITALLYFKPGGGALYFGLDCGTADHAPVASSPDGFYIGFNGSGQRARFFGIGALTVQEEVVVGSNPGVDTTMLASIDIDPNFISMSLRSVGGTTDFYSFKVTRSSLVTAGKTINNVSLFMQDARALSGNAISPVVAVKSLQPARTKTLGGQTVEGAESRHIVTRSSGGDPWRIQVPKTYDARKPAPVVLWMHQSLTGTVDTLYSESRSQAIADTLGDAGFILASANDGGDRWGNQASLDNYRALYEYVRDNFNTGPLFVIGASMGSLPVLNALVRRKWVTPAAVATIGGVVNLDDLWANNTGSYAASIRAAYGIAADGSDYASKTAGWNPAQRAGYEFRGVPMRFYTSTGDTTVPKATNQEALAAKVLPYAPEATVVLGSGAHLDASQYQASDLLSFFQTYS